MIDDPIKDRKEADSPTFREDHWNWYRDVVYTRLAEDAAIILTLTRWHHDDIAGRLLELMNQGKGVPWKILTACRRFRSSRSTRSPRSRSSSTTARPRRPARPQAARAARPEPLLATRRCSTARRSSVSDPGRPSISSSPCRKRAACSRLNGSARRSASPPCRRGARASAPGILAPPSTATSRSAC
jgi:hypothetical protein